MEKKEPSQAEKIREEVLQETQPETTAPQEKEAREEPLSEDSSVTTPPQPPQPKKPSLIREVVTFILLTLIIVVPLRLYIAQPYIVNGNSMDPTFATGDYLIVDQLSYRLGEPERGDVAIFRFPLEPSKFFIKRVIGLPGETVSIEGNVVTITRADSTTFILPEPYLTHIGIDHVILSLEEDEYFVLGDNREASLDSRIWGAVHKDFLIGRALLQLLPITDVGYLPGSTDYLLEN